ncbi:hypothetical protein U5A82_08630 [Sphingobium sp. CR2-8]|uniref:hypothetical protein n=1 Tax=Sphingobium sp. CR2-8 TaxID=1306534 RepID=UPI002DBC9E00|nr:hypothetical protein [Sphingobium sp. CR2-8]MEC3910547.1 hypothetical protein [Sphingobium sp. CR2-8]
MRHGMESWWSGKGAYLRLPVVAALWTLILVTLLSALAPLGPPLSRATGSAFNPATADVVLKARAHAAFQAVDASTPTHDGPSPPLILAVALAIVLLAIHHVRLPGMAGRDRHHPRAFAPARTRHARAPPAAS